jgi:restriction endonuclease S subunit
MYSISKGCTQQNINQGILKSATIPLPPLAEQKRIAEQIETIFASLDTITAEL